MKIYDKAYFAGFFDGEGSVAVYKAGGKHNSYYLRTQVTQNRTKATIKIMRFLKKQYGGSLSLQETSSGNIKYNWQLSAKNAIKFLEDIQPFIVLKKTQVDLAIDWQKQRPKMIRNTKGQIQTIRPENLKYTKWVSNELKKLKREFI